MEKNMYIVTGATGRTGRIVTNILLNQGKDVRAIARDTDKLRDLETNGAKILSGNLEDKNFVVRAFQGAKAAYLMVPPNNEAEDFLDYQMKVADNQAEAIKKNKITHAVLLSSVGAELTEKAGVVQGLHYMEKRLNRIKSLNIKHIRATYFMENLFQTIQMVKSSNKLSLPFNHNLKFPMTAKRDVAKVAVQHLLDLDFEGKSVDYVLGQRDLSFTEVADILGKAIGITNLEYTQTSYENTRTAWVRSGISESVADAYIEFIRGINEGRIFENVERTPENTTPISIEEFSRQYALLYENSRAMA
ncbi:MAG: NmrA family NAD(P)-binding protein [Balneolales bacterium]